MSSYRIGQDVLVESHAVYNGDAFIAQVSEETSDLIGDGLYVDLEDREDLEADVALVSRQSVVSLTEVFDTIRNS